MLQQPLGNDEITYILDLLQSKVSRCWATDNKIINDSEHLFKNISRSIDSLSRLNLRVGLGDLINQWGADSIDGYKRQPTFMLSDCLSSHQNILVQKKLPVIFYASH